MASPPDDPGAPVLRLEGLQSPLAGPFSLSLARGACAAITGASGSGKSLFLRMIADLDPNEGVAELGGRARQGFPPSEWRRRVAYVAAEAGWWADAVGDHFRPGDLDRAAALAGELGLATEMVKAQVARLSTGERQRLALVRAMALDPPVLLLDEPTGALDQDSAGRVEALLRRLMAQGTAVVLVTHDPPLGRRLGTAHYRMAERKLTPA